MSLPRLEHGARLVCLINGLLVGSVYNFNFTSVTNRTSIRGIDLSYPQEIGASTTEVSGTLSLYRPLGIGGIQGIGFVAQAADLAFEKYATLLILDIASDLPIFKCDLTQVTSESWSIAPKQLMTGTVSFSGIAWSNESSD